MVVRYDSINEFLFPSVAWCTALMLPFLGYFGIWEEWPLYLHPIQAPLVLLEAAFRPVSGAEIVYGVLYAVLWIGLTFVLCLRAFHRFVINVARP